MLDFSKTRILASVPYNMYNEIIGRTKEDYTGLIMKKFQFIWWLSQVYWDRPTWDAPQAILNTNVQYLLFFRPDLYSGSFRHGIKINPSENQAGPRPYIAVQYNVIQGNYIGVPTETCTSLLYHILYTTRIYCMIHQHIMVTRRLPPCLPRRYTVCQNRVWKQRYI